MCVYVCDSVCVCVCMHVCVCVCVCVWEGGCHNNQAHFLGTCIVHMYVCIQTYLDPSSCQSAVNSSSSALPNGSHLSTSLHSNSTNTCPPGWAPFSEYIENSTYIHKECIHTYIYTLLHERYPLLYS